MRCVRDPIQKVRWLVLVASAVVVACGHTQSTVTSNAALQTAATWPASLVAIGEGFPSPGAACRIVGENAVTVNFLDDSATLVGCTSLAEAVKLGGKIVATVDGITLVSVPSTGARQGTRVPEFDR
jgi:hypothetical protein